MMMAMTLVIIMILGTTDTMIPLDLDILAEMVMLKEMDILTG